MSVNSTTSDELGDIPGQDSAETGIVTVYNAIGGRPALVAAVNGLYARLLADSDLSPFFPRGVSDRHRQYLVTILAEALGGPERYRGPDVAGTHRSLGISDADFNSVPSHLDPVLAELGVPRPLADRVIETVASFRGAVVSA